MAVFVVFVTTYMLILPAITLSVGSSLPKTASMTITDVDQTKNTSVTYDGTNYTASLTVSFTVEVDEIKQNNYVASYYLPEGVTPPSSYVAGTKLYNNDLKQIEYYYYEQDSSGNWYIYVVFDSSVVNTMSGTLTGSFGFNATISNDYYSDDEGLKVQFDDNVYLTITDTPSTANDNGGADISVTKKSSSGYDADSNSITYTIKVSSTKGTDGVITLKDIIDEASLSSDVTIDSVKIDSIYYYDYDSSGETSESNKTELQESANTSVSSTTYYATDYSATDGMTITLPEILGTKDSDENNGVYEYGGEYIITYTVTFEDLSGNVSENIKNTASASADSGTITNSAEISYAITHTVLSKTAEASDDGATITWTIVVNAAGEDISGYTLSDSMLSGVDYNDINVATLSA